MPLNIPRWNRHIGWLLLIAAFVWAIWLDPWSLGETDPRALPGSARMAARQAQAVVIGMAFLQLILAPILAREIFSAKLRRFVATVTGCGALVYSAGYALAANYPSGAWLIPIGALFNAVGFGSLAFIGWKARADKRNLTGLCIILSAITFGMLLDALMGLFAANSAFMPALLGAEDGVRLRMLRLARAAAIALSVLALLYHDLLGNNPENAHTERGRKLMIGGALGMPLILSLAAFGNLGFKYLLPLPAFAVFYGTIVGGVLTWKRPGRGWEFWGWAMIALSMGAGLLMGMYAFDGPLASPLGAYNEFARRLSRLGHAYCIVLGLLVIFLAREIQESHLQDRQFSEEAIKARGTQWLQVCGSALLVTGVICTNIVILLVAANWLPTRLLGVGPAIVALSTLLFLGFDRRIHTRQRKRKEEAL